MLGFPGYVVRINPGPNPTETALAEVYEPPFPGYGPRGGDIDRNGVFWASLASGHLASFDRRKCKGPLNGPTATGKHCPEGWTLYPFPGPQFRDVTEPGSAEASYYTWVDQFDTFGLGKNVPIATGNANESLLALVDGKFVNLRVPYPLGFYTKWMDGRIDDPNAGWKGKGLWSTFSTRAMVHVEGGKGTGPRSVKFQLRPDPLARRSTAGWLLPSAAEFGFSPCESQGPVRRTGRYALSVLLPRHEEVLPRREHVRVGLAEGGP